LNFVCYACCYSAPHLRTPLSLEDLCDPRRMALLVYDMQVGVLSQIENGAEITGRVLKVLRAARESGIRVIFSRHMSLPKELMGVFQMRMAMAWQRVATVEEVKPWFIRDTPGFHLIPELSPRPTEAIFDKITSEASVLTERMPVFPYEFRIERMRRFSWHLGTDTSGRSWF
jgi:biuret amidohydrolase